MSFEIGAVNISKTNLRKLLEDLRGQYPHSPLHTLIIETFANALDACASKIDISYESGHYSIRDNGKGMDPHSFIEYHNVASISKTRGSGGIGFAGVGAKAYLDRAEYIITETKTHNSHLASKWYLHDEDSKWEPIAPPYNMDSIGTIVNVKINLNDALIISNELIKDILRTHYNAILLGFYEKEMQVTVNSVSITPWKPEIELIKKIHKKIGPHEIKGYFVLAKQQVPSDNQGIAIVVHGKTINREMFRQVSNQYERITGIIIADHLINCITTSKTSFDDYSAEWKSFYQTISQELAQWLEEIGARVVPERSNKYGSMIKRLEESINDVLKNPEFDTMMKDLFLNKLKVKTLIEQDTGKISTAITEGTQLVEGLTDGEMAGKNGLPTSGPNEGKGISREQNGEQSAVEKQRIRKSGVKIGFIDAPNNLAEGWIDYASKTITINTGHSAYKIACALSIEGKSTNAWYLHVYRTIVHTLTHDSEKIIQESQSNDKITENRFLKVWYDNSIDNRIKREVPHFTSQISTTENEKPS